MEYRNVRNYILEGFYSIAEGMSNLTIFPKKISTLEEIYNKFDWKKDVDAMKSDLENYWR